MNYGDGNQYPTYIDLKMHMDATYGRFQDVSILKQEVQNLTNIVQNLQANVYSLNQQSTKSQAVVEKYKTDLYEMGSDLADTQDLLSIRNNQIEMLKALIEVIQDNAIKDKLRDIVDEG